MKIRITGTEKECSDFVATVLKSIPKGYIRNISGFYPNTRKCAYSNEGRVDIDLNPIAANERLIEGD